MIEEVMKCPCFYFDEDEPGTGRCACGHEFDEHDDHLECMALYIEPEL
jgi:hypothetical protein